MSATVTSMRDLIDTVRPRVPRHLHPCGERILFEWLKDAYAADHRGDVHEVAHLLAMVRDKIVQELRWEAESYKTVGTSEAFRHACYPRRQANPIAGVRNCEPQQPRPRRAVLVTPLDALWLWTSVNSAKSTAAAEAVVRFDAGARHA